MAEYTIRPWIHDGYPDPDMTVPPEVEALAQKVMSRYDMKVNNMTLITAKSDKGGAIWKIETNRGPRSLKVLHRAPERSLFSVGAQEYLVKQGARVPQLIPTKKGKLHTQAGGKLWIVTDWEESLIQASKIDLAGAQDLCYGLGEFHRLSRGYVEPKGAYRASRLYRWPKAYDKVLTKVGWFRTLAQTYSDLPASHTLLQVVDKYEEQARQAIQRLEQSPYAQLTERGEAEWGLVHQDFGWSNGQMGRGGIWIIDLDGVAFDLPIRDLRKLITSTMDDMGVWDVTWMRGMIDAYSEACPIEPELYEVLLIDMALPNEFYKNIKEIVYDPPTFMTTELEPLLQRLETSEPTKWQALKELGLTGTGVKAQRKGTKVGTRTKVAWTGPRGEWTGTKAEWTGPKAERTGMKAKRTETETGRTGTKAIRTETKTERTGTKVVWTGTKAERTETKTERTETKTERTGTKAERTGTKAERTGTKAIRTETKAIRTETKTERMATKVVWAGMQAKRTGSTAQRKGGRVR